MHESLQRHLEPIENVISISLQLVAVNTSHFKFDLLSKSLVISERSFEVIDSSFCLAENDDLVLLLILHHLQE